MQLVEQTNGENSDKIDSEPIYTCIALLKSCVSIMNVEKCYL